MSGHSKPTKWPSMGPGCLTELNVNGFLEQTRRPIVLVRQTNARWIFLFGSTCVDALIIVSTTLFIVTKTFYQKERRAQVIACDCLKDLKTLYKLLQESIDKVKYGLYCPTLARDDPSIMFCYIPVKVRKLLDMGFLIKMILSASARFFQSENPMVKDLEVRIEVDQEERGHRKSPMGTP